MGTCDYVPLMISVLLIVLCSIAISFRNMLNEHETCGQNRDKACASGGFMNFQFSLLVIGLVVGILYVSRAIYIKYGTTSRASIAPIGGSVYQMAFGKNMF